MSSTLPPKGNPDADIVRVADGTSTYETSPMADAAGTTREGAPLDRPIDRPVTQPSYTTPAAAPLDRPIDRPVAQPSYTAPTAAPLDRPIDRPVTQPTYTTADRTSTHPRASTDAAPVPDDAIVAAADGSSDYEHSDMAAAVDDAQHHGNKVK